MRDAQTCLSHVVGGGSVTTWLLLKEIAAQGVFSSCEAKKSQLKTADWYEHKKRKSC